MKSSGRHEVAIPWCPVAHKVGGEGEFFKSLQYKFLCWCSPQCRLLRQVQAKSATKKRNYPSSIIHDSSRQFCDFVSEDYILPCSPAWPNRSRIVLDFSTRSNWNRILTTTTTKQSSWGLKTTTHDFSGSFLFHILWVFRLHFGDVFTSSSEVQHFKWHSRFVWLFISSSFSSFVFLLCCVQHGAKVW